MDAKKDISLLTDQVLNCLDGIQRAETQPFFYTRLKARMEGGELNEWNKWMSILSRPVVSLGILLIFLMINGYLIFSKMEAEKEVSMASSDYAAMQVSYLDNNPELP